MLSNAPSNLFHSPIYQKAMEIIILSRSISTYLNQDLNGLLPNGAEDDHIYFSGDIVQQSVSLAPEIEKAEQERYTEKKHKHIASIKRLTSLLNKNVKRLENCNSNGKDYLPLLRSELQKFKKLQHTWMLTL
ncbi:hypothetical protein C1T31_07620 [Hanstruepera neustonica]|uniref:Uncharacterized protein n=1 Tax=Hanstruepera neustonica TaxID=1445657 RepID=A0A2K1DZC0_9FLAO|nr:hypothetical protein [Hanstruepera neustonica]PNQ73376.1 hypothetical protein C1T31_07620 [Hanstruepera neustonica]